MKRVLSKIGVSATQVDQQLFCMHRNKDLVLLMTIHVDDIKLCGDPAVMTDVIFQLECHLDSVKLEKNNFVHLGLEHSLRDDGSITVSQTHHYMSELRSIPEDRLRTMSKRCSCGRPVQTFVYVIAWRNRMGCANEVGCCCICWCPAEKVAESYSAGCSSPEPTVASRVSLR